MRKSATKMHNIANQYCSPSLCKIFTGEICVPRAQFVSKLFLRIRPKDEISSAILSLELTPRGPASCTLTTRIPHSAPAILRNFRDASNLLNNSYYRAGEIALHHHWVLQLKITPIITRAREISLIYFHVISINRNNSNRSIMSETNYKIH
jgi:hypothetical protein